MRTPLKIVINGHSMVSLFFFLCLSNFFSFSIFIPLPPSPWHMKCQRCILEAVRSQLEISALIGLPAINDVIRHRRITVFGHIARLQDNTPAHKALQSHVNLSLGRLPHPSWSRRPGRSRGRWIDQIRNDTSQTPADLWRQALGCGHHGRSSRRPTLAMR